MSDPKTILAVVMALVLVGGGDQAGADGGALVTSSVELEPVLIGTAPPDASRELDQKAKWDGPVNIVIDSPYQIWSAMGTYIHVAAFDPGFAPAAGAEVYLDRRIACIADEHGTCVFSDASNQDTGYSNRHDVDVVYRKGQKAYHGSVYFNAYPRTQGFESASVFVYTDRGVYNPGQTIRIRAIAWRLRDDFEPLAARPLDLLLKDESGRVVAGGQVETDGHGIATFDIPLPEHAPEGRYGLEATFERETASARLRIERFVAPAIDIQHDLGRFLTRDAKALEIAITLGMFGGGAFTKGTLALRIEAGGEIRFEKVMDVEGKGPHKVALDEAALAKVKKDLYEDANVRVTIAVRDEFGRTDELKRDMRYTANPYRVVVEMDKDQYAEGDTVRAMVRVVDLDEVPIRARKVKLVVDGKDHFSETDDGGIAKFELVMGKQTVYGSVFIEGVDASLATMYAYYHPPRPMTSEIPEGVVKEKKKTEIVIRFPLDFRPVEDVVHVDIVDSSGALIGAALVPVAKEKEGWIARGKFPAPSWGSMLLTIFCLGRSGSAPIGLLTEGQNLPVVADRALEIRLKGLPEKAAPGQALDLSAEVVGKDGKPVTAAVGASIVDQAVIGMLDPLELTPMDKFYNPQLKVLSSTGSKILTWPVVSRNFGYPLYDIALPPFGFRAGGQAPAAEKSGGAYYNGPSKKGKKTPLKPMKKPKLALEGIGSGGGGYGMGGSASFATGPASAPVQFYQKSLDMPAGGEKEEDVLAEAAIGSLAVGAGAPVKPKDVTVVIRTNFAETSLWEPDLFAEGGKVKFDAVLPDSITTQTVTLVASDDEGRVGLLREEVDVGQDLYARSDVPATLTLGDDVEVGAAVRNFTGKKVTVEVGIESEDLEIVGPDSSKVTVPSGGTGVARFRVRPIRAGEAAYEVWVEGASIKDVERRTLFIRPSTIPTVIRARGTLEKGDPFEATVHLSGKDAHVEAFLGVSMPGAVPAIQGLDAILGQPGGAIDFLSSRALVTAMVYRYLAAYGTDEGKLAPLADELQACLASLLMSQNPDGGWGWHVALIRSGASGETGLEVPVSNPYMTAQTLEGLVEMKRAGLPVPASTVRSALQVLVSSQAEDGLWSVESIAFWEGKTDEVRLGIGAEIFRVMVLACEAFPDLALDPAISASLGKLSARFRPVLADPLVRDPMVLGHASLAVWMWAALRGDSDPKLAGEIDAVAARLVAIRDQAYWEPSWFNAFGGTIEATAAAVELLHALDPSRFDAELRLSIQYILSTRESFGAWHNARGTAAAIRTLLLVPPTAKEIPSTVEVRVNGKTIRTVEIDPDDPYISAVSLRQIEITSHLHEGDNSVEVLYDGNLEAPVELTVHKWAKSTQALAMPGAPRIVVARTAKDLSGSGLLVEVKLHLGFEDKPVPVVVTEPIPSNADVDPDSLDALLASGAILGYDLLPDSLVLYPRPGALDLAYRLAGTRTGTAIHPGTRVAPLSDPTLVVTGKASKMRVE